jgi:hypothetical protein
MPAMPALMPVLNNGRMAYALVQLADHLGDDARDAHRARARRVTDALAAAALRSPAGAALALARQRLDAPPTLIDRGLAPGGILDGGPD